ncbi:hypothetical protein GCK72_021315 [Caenorhabditis remanei]|uniref:Uncharacterized protein n=1 Tax=Caenorhabditis remanei TaxID=31234 RepID=A0A6A5GJF0_CAERE|nr:hypothetical protein GCK72_021315 [Caenorhabditis remanei]KAF1754751.1 hypothetical protein GCK72_021315 [Caenorhabditis remanei]
MQKLEPIWQNLPFFFKSQVVENLDYKDRCCLRKCSKADLYLVDSSPNRLDSIAINTYENYSFLSWSDTGKTVYTVKYYKNCGETDLRLEFSAAPSLFIPTKNEKILFKKTKILQNLDPKSDDMDHVLIDFSIALKKLTCDKILIGDVILKGPHPTAHPEKTMKFRERLLNQMTSPIKAKCLYLKWGNEMDEVEEILKNFDSKTLKKLEISDRNAFWELSKIMKMEQWKKAEKVHLEVLSDLKIDDLMHFSEIQMHVRTLEENDLWKVIQNFITKNQHRSFFHFSYRTIDPDLQRILGTFNVPIKDEPIRASTQVRQMLERRINHTQRFPMPSPDLVLVVMIADKEVMGTVCRKDNVDVEAKVETGILRE